MLKAAILSPAQIDTTLCDISQYLKLVKQAHRLKNDTLRTNVLYVLDCGYENANDTIMLERAAPTAEWDYMFEASCGTMLAGCGETGFGRNVERWFSKRGFQW